MGMQFDLLACLTGTWYLRCEVTRSVSLVPLSAVYLSYSVRDAPVPALLIVAPYHHGHLLSTLIVYTVRSTVVPFALIVGE